MRRTILPILTLATTLATPALGAPLDLPQQTLAFDALGTEVSLPITAEVDVSAQGDERLATGSAVGDLGDLQAKAVPIAQAIPLPREPCANENGLNIVLDAIHSATITAEGEVARLEAVGTVTGYGCLMGVGAPVASTQVALAAPLKLDVAPPSDVGLVLAGPVELIAAGLPPDFTALLNEQVNQAVSEALARARTGSAPAIAGVPDLVIDISDAAFFSEGETLMVRLEGASTMSKATFDTLLAELGATAPEGL